MKVLEISNLSKQYRLGQIGTGTLSHDLNRWIAKVRGKQDPYAKVGESNDRTSAVQSGYVWALQDISFEMNQGDVLGVIGRNGAGKSTLLKLLSNITAPTEGSIKYKGRIAALLEVGTGFHPELTGRENVFLNGAILGMSKAEITSKLDQIVEFSGCAAYIDTPVKRYSSGMLVRLGFSVAAHMDPDILVVDEVLAVGDLEFQQKCLGKMSEVSKSGRTVLFVSHNMQAVSKLCTKGIYLNNGRLVSSGKIENVLEEYVKSGDLNTFSYKNQNIIDSDGTILSAEVQNSKHEPIGEISVGEKWRIRIEFQLKKQTKHVIVAAGFSGVMDENLNTTWSNPHELSEGRYELIFTNDDLLFAAGTYYVTLGLSTFERSLNYLPAALSFSIVESTKFAYDSRIVRTRGSGLILNQLVESLKKV